MYLVLRGFANNDISATKGKVIKNLDKRLASALIDAGYITPYSEKEMSNKEKDETIKSLTKQVEDKDSEIASLKARVEELEIENNELKATKEASETDGTPTEPPTPDADNSENKDKDNLDNAGSTSNEDGENNGGEPTGDKEAELKTDDKQSSKSKKE